MRLVCCLLYGNVFFSEFLFFVILLYMIRNEKGEFWFKVGIKLNFFFYVWYMILNKCNNLFFKNLFECKNKEV